MVSTLGKKLVLLDWSLLDVEPDYLHPEEVLALPLVILGWLDNEMTHLVLSLDSQLLVTDLIGEESEDAARFQSLNPDP